MSTTRPFEIEVLSTDEANDALTKLRSSASSWRTSKFDPLKQHIQWLDRGSVLRIDEMTRSDVANLRSYIERNVTPVGKRLQYVVRSSRIDDTSDVYRVFIFCQKK